MARKREIVSYKLTREDGQEYIGITVNINARLSQHKKHPRFSELELVKYEILKTYDTYEEAQKDEPLLIEKYDTFYNGLNESIDGKGNHLSPNFNTHGYKFTEEQRNNMKRSHWSKNPDIDTSWLYRPCPEDIKQKISKSKKGQIGSYKIDLDTKLLIEESYKNDTIQFSNDFIAKYVKVSQRDKLDELTFDELISPNGKPLNKLTLYAHYFAGIYNITDVASKNICLGKFIKDENAYV